MKISGNDALIIISNTLDMLVKESSCNNDERLDNIMTYGMSSMLSGLLMICGTHDIKKDKIMEIYDKAVADTKAALQDKVVELLERKKEVVAMKDEWEKKEKNCKNN